VAILLREHPLPAPVQWRRGILPVERIRHLHSAPPERPGPSRGSP
jgi:hypothetical protein